MRTMQTKAKILVVFAFFALATTTYLSSYDPMYNRDHLKFYWKNFSSGKPMCQNMLSNLTNGKWKRKIFLTNDTIEYERLSTQEQILDLHLAEYRIKRGIHTRLWRDDGKCGYKNYQAKPKGSIWGGPVGAWCNANSSKPCCSDEFDGVCGSICDCPTCVDMREIHHAEVSDWIPSDARCHRFNYTSYGACDVLKKFEQIHFVGDSFVRKMSRALVLLLRSDPVYGAMTKYYNDKQRKLCVGLDQFYWTECRFPGGDIHEFLVNTSSFCSNYSPKIIDSAFYSNQHAGEFLKLVKRLAGWKNTVIFLGVGGHDGCSSHATQKYYLGPALEYLEEYYRKPDLVFEYRWPHLVFMYPDSPGLLKSLRYQTRNGKVPCNKFSREMKAYCDHHGIKILDFSKLTTGVHSYDGTHHGIGVNIMKIQFMLNYLDSIL